MADRAAVIQMVSGSDVHGNLEVAARLIERAAGEGAGLVSLPENFAVLDAGPLTEYAEAEADPGGLLQGFLAETARTHGIILVGGTIPLITRPVDPAGGNRPPERLTDGRVRAACLVFDRQGRQIARYDKIHLFDVTVADRQAQYLESSRFEPGGETVCVDTDAGRLGLSICYDLRFAELYRALSESGAELITVPSAFTRTTGAAHWEVLVRSRAIEFQCFVVAANQGGVHNARRETYGHSMIVDPWGTVLAQVDTGEGVAVADLDLARINQVRNDMPIGGHRRL